VASAQSGFSDQAEPDALALAAVPARTACAGAGAGFAFAVAAVIIPPVNAANAMPAATDSLNGQCLIRTSLIPALAGSDASNRSLDLRGADVTTLF
jgi:hypothetical protein